MSQENIEIVRRAFAEFGEYPATGRLEEAVRTGRIAPDAELDFSGMYPDGPILRGVETWPDYLRSLPWGRSMKLEAERFFDVDDERVLVFVHLTAEGQTSEVPASVRNAHEYTFRDGVCVRMKVYADRTEALKAAGLSE
jgi:ketosteroid isomerase-like protein